MIREYGYGSAGFSRTFDCYDYVDCFNYMNLHDQLKLCKHGYSKVTDHASREIRHGRLTREEGLALVRRHELATVDYSQLFLDWLGVTQQSLQFIMNQHRNPHFWNQPEFGKWAFNGWSVRQDIDNPGYVESCDLPVIFEANDKLEYDRDAKYITIGKGWS